MITRAEVEEALLAASTENQRSRVLIDLGTIMTPTELAGLLPLADDRAIPADARSWLLRLVERCPDLRDRPGGFERETVTDRLTLYRGRRDPERPGSLLIGFAGQAGRLMLPAPLFLQAVPAEAWNVLVVARVGRGPLLDPGREPEAVQSYVDEIRPLAAGYADAVILGVSAGARVAALAADGIAARRCVAVGIPWRGGWEPPRLDAELLLVFAADHERDAEAAACWQRASGGRLVPVPGLAQHNVLDALQRRGDLDAFLRWMLEGEASACPWTLP